MHLTDSSKRLILKAASDIKAGHDVLIVAHPHDVTVGIARMVCKVVRDRGIVCANLPECRGEGPRVRVREYTAEIPFPTPRHKVHIDVSAVFEKGSCGVPLYRRVD